MLFQAKRGGGVIGTTLTESSVRAVDANTRGATSSMRLIISGAASACDGV